MGVGGVNHGLLDHDGSLVEGLIDVAKAPFDRRRALGQLVIARKRKILAGPFDLAEVDTAAGDVAARERIRTAGLQTFERIDAKRQRLEFDLDCRDGVLRCLLGLGRDRHDRLAGISGLGGKDRLPRGLRLLHLIRRKGREKARNLHRFRKVDVLHLGVGHR